MLSFLIVTTDSSTQLRQDAVSLLKDIVILIQSAVAKIGDENLSVRTKFMIETISNLKENRMKTGAIASTIATEHRLRLRKTLRSLNSRNIKASEPLRIGLADIRNADKRGKWWLVGASYRDQSRDSTKQNESQQDTLKPKSLASKSNDLIQLAREQGMNTDVRRSIFVAVMSATDYQDAHIRLQKLRLKNAQELEIPKVLMHCCGAEENYNHFYSLVSRRICSDRKLKKAFQFSLWNLFKQMGEDRDNKEGNQSDHHEDVIGLRNFVNLAKMFGVLIAEDGLRIGVLKVSCVHLIGPYLVNAEACCRYLTLLFYSRRLTYLSNFCL